MIRADLFCKRNIQAMRGIAIILVVLHHALNNSVMFSLKEFAISLTHADVVIFLFISGFLYEKKLDQYSQTSASRFIINKFQRLMIPYFFWTIILYLLVDLAHGIFGGKISSILNGLGFPFVAPGKALVNTVLFLDVYVEHLWFLYVLFIFFVVSRLVNRANRLLCNWFCIITLVVAGSFAIYYLKPPYLVNKIIYYFPDFLLGRLICRKREKIPTTKSLIFVVLLSALATALFFTVLRPVLLKNSIRNSLVYLFQHIQYWTEFFAALLLIEYVGKRNKLTILGSIGDNSFAIYLMHTPYIVPVVSRVVSQHNIIISIIISVGFGVLIPWILKQYVFDKFGICNIFLFGEQRKQNLAE